MLISDMHEACKNTVYVLSALSLSKNVKSSKDGSNPKLPNKGSSRGGTIELL